MLAHLLNKHEKAILQFSGGKDSLAILNLCKSHLDRILVVHLDTGAGLPHMDDFIREAVDRVGGTLRIIRPEMPQVDSIRMFGSPVDIAPLR
ncbi:MAG: phosphoadenosine phosphosulfate reductase family protein, partial [Deltaproteobacteria bacterium]|nr:phosphoadenosine phosphosulfate reductase family protein [Deltaproteobacteria bacterium]